MFKKLFKKKVEKILVVVWKFAGSEEILVERTTSIGLAWLEADPYAEILKVEII